MNVHVASLPSQAGLSRLTAVLPILNFSGFHGPRLERDQRRRRVRVSLEKRGREVEGEEGPIRAKALLLPDLHALACTSSVFLGSCMSLSPSSSLFCSNEPKQRERLTDNSSNSWPFWLRPTDVRAANATVDSAISFGICRSEAHTLVMWGVFPPLFRSPVESEAANTGEQWLTSQQKSMFDVQK